MWCASEKSTIKLFKSEQRTDHSETVKISESIEAAEQDVPVQFVYDRDTEVL